MFRVPLFDGLEGKLLPQKGRAPPKNDEPPKRVLRFLLATFGGCRLKEDFQMGLFVGCCWFFGGGGGGCGRSCFQGRRGSNLAVGPPTHEVHRGLRPRAHGQVEELGIRLPENLPFRW